MAYMISLNTFTDERGSLNVIESNKDIPFEIKRVFYIYNLSFLKPRGGHRHKKTKLALICLNGSCRIYNNNNKGKAEFFLDSPSKCLILEPEDYHTMYDFTDKSIIMVLASEYYNKSDYILEDYK